MLDLLGTVVISLLLILFGLVVTFYGYGIFRLLLPVIGFIAGLLIGRALLPDNAFWGWVVGLLLAVVFAYISYAYWSVMVTMSGALLGFTLGTSLMQMIGFWDWIGVVVGIVLAFVFGALYFAFRDLFVMASTAFTGAGLVFYGLGKFLPWFEFLRDQGNWLTFILTLVLGIIGAVVQMQLFTSLRYYSAEHLNEPPPVVIPPGSAAPATR